MPQGPHHTKGTPTITPAHRWGILLWITLCSKMAPLHHGRDKAVD